MMPLTNEKSQIEKFKEKARELECDPSDESFDAALKNFTSSRTKAPKTNATKKKPGG